MTQNIHWWVLGSSLGMGIMATWETGGTNESNTKTRPGKHTKSYRKWPFIVDFPIEHGDFP
jgi:hypothetical protein